MSISNISSAAPSFSKEGLHDLNQIALNSVQGMKSEPSDPKTREAALQFEQIMIRQLLEPLEKSLSKSFGGGSNSPMVGGMIMSSLSQSITDGGGLGLASVIEEALRKASPAPVSVGETPTHSDIHRGSLQKKPK
jgi:Rod binding domain-containing protein